MAVLILLAAVIHVGGVASLASTNSKFSPWMALAYLAGFGLIAAIQFVAGHREHVWSRAGLVVWIVAGGVFVAALLGGGAVLLYFGVGL